MGQLGESIFVEEDESHRKYLKIELAPDEFEQITQRYESLLQ